MLRWLRQAGRDASLVEEGLLEARLETSGTGWWRRSSGGGIRGSRIAWNFKRDLFSVDISECGINPVNNG
jgi:hypothetical protein